MKQLIRHSVFETNSSSCHSISIAQGMELNNIPYPDNNGNIKIESGEFGWEVDSYNDFDSKASYLIVYIRDWSRGKKEEFRNIFENVIKEQTGCENILYEDQFWDIETKEYEYEGKVRSYESNLGRGYIDHQSVEDGDLDYMFENISEMKDFLFCTGSVLYTDNDNK